MPLSRTVAPYSSANREPDQPIRERRRHPPPFIPVTNPLERVNKEVKRRTNVVGIFPDDAAVLRLAGAVLIEAHDEWQVAERRYLSEGSMAKLAATGDDAARPKEVRRATAELVTT
jgi:transposase-like protein